MATNWVDVWQSLSRRELFRKTGVATGVMLVLGSLLDKASAQPVPLMRAPASAVLDASAQPVPLMQAPAPGLAGTTDYFLKIEGIEGESFDYKHKGEIDVLSFSWGATQSGALGGGGGAGKVQMEGMKFVMRVNKASPKVMLACATGLHFKGAILTARKAGKSQQEYLKWTMTDVLVSSYQTGGSQGTIPADQFALNFGRIDVEYNEQRPDGSLGLPTRAGYDLRMNKAM
jgi:type VI secretion system secreted protein Hcp